MRGGYPSLSGRALRLGKWASLVLSGGWYAGCPSVPFAQAARAPVVRHAQQEASLSFWNWRRGTAPTASEGTAAVSLATQLAPIELYTADARIVAWIDPSGHRVTDLLSSQDEIRLWRPSPGPLDSDEAIETVLPADDTEQSGDWQTLTTETIILAMPPEWRSRRPR